MIKLNELLITVEETKGGFRLFKRISFNNEKHWLSVQASYGHYCNPRETLSKEEYDTFEVMANIPDEDIPLSWESHHDSGGVYGYVPREEIESLIEKLNQKYGLDSE